MAPTIHFLFPDGALGHDCARCDQRCCAGGVLLHLDRDRHVLDRAPDLRVFTRPGPGPRLRVLEMPRPRCYFVRDDGRCELHHQGGHAAKPAMCRLFPVNLAWRLPAHDAIVVGLFVSICPLEVVAGDATGGLRHDALLGEVRAALDGGELTPTRAAPHLDRFPRDFLTLEQRLLAGFARDRQRPLREVLATQLAITTHPRPLDHVPGEDEVAAARGAIRDHVAEVAALLGIADPPEPDPDTAAGLMAMAGLLRMSWLLEPSDLDHDEHMVRLPFALATLGLLAACQVRARTTIAPGAPGLGLQAIHALSRSLGPLAMITTYLDDAVVATGPLPPAVRPLVSPPGRPQALADRLAAAVRSHDDRMQALRALAEARAAVRFVGVR